MALTLFSNHQLFQPQPRITFCYARPSPTTHTPSTASSFSPLNFKFNLIRPWKYCSCNFNNKSKSAAAARVDELVEDQSKENENCKEEEEENNEVVERLVEFLYQDLPHLFDEQGIDRSMYDERVQFRDPITKHDTIDGYLFNIKLLKLLFHPLFQLHHVRQTGPYEITTRWTMVMRFVLLPWKPELVFTGVSLMGINPQTEKFCSHVDLWDSIKNNTYFSLEGLLDVLKQLRIYKTPKLKSPNYQILRRTANYEVRKYDPYVVVETKGDKLSGSAGFNDVAGYIFGKNSRSEKIPMTTPVFTRATNTHSSTVSIQIVLPPEKALKNLPNPTKEEVRLRNVEGSIAAVVKFSGKSTEDIVCEKERVLRSLLLQDGLKPIEGCLFARYNDPGSTWSFLLGLCAKLPNIGIWF